MYPMLKIFIRVSCYFIYLVAASAFGGDDRASLSLMVQAKPDSLWRASKGLYSSGAEYNFLVLKQNNQDSEHEGFFWIKFLKNTISFLRIPAETTCFLLSTKNGDHENILKAAFSLEYPNQKKVDREKTEYCFFKSIQHLKKQFAQHKGLSDMSGGLSGSLSSDLEIILVFDFAANTNDNLKRKIENYVVEFAKDAKWQCAIKRDTESDKCKLRIIIPLGNEDNDNNNYQRLFLDKKEVTLDIAKCCIRKKNKTGKQNCFFFPKKVTKTLGKEWKANIIPDANANGNAIEQNNAEDYCLFAMIEPETTSTSLWFFPRAHQSLNVPSSVPSVPELTDGSDDKAISIDEMRDICSREWGEKPITSVVDSQFFMLLTGCFASKSSPLEAVQNYLHKFDYVIKDMPKDNYCGWHAIAEWIKIYDPEMEEKLFQKGLRNNNPGQALHKYLKEIATDNAKNEKASKKASKYAKNIAKKMSSEKDMDKWLDCDLIYHLAAPLIKNSFLVLDTCQAQRGFAASDWELPFSAQIIDSKGIYPLTSKEEIEKKIEEIETQQTRKEENTNNPSKIKKPPIPPIVLLHDTNHWLLILKKDIYVEIYDLVNELTHMINLLKPISSL